MPYQKWKESVIEAFYNAGFERQEALMRANSVRGLYYDERRYPQPEDVVDHVVKQLTPLERIWLRRIAKRRVESQLKGYAVVSRQTA